MNNQLGGTSKLEVGTLKRIVRTLQQDHKTQNILEEDVKASIIGLYPQTFIFILCFKEKKISGSNCKLKPRNHKNTFYRKQEKKEVNVRRIKDKECSNSVRKEKESYKWNDSWKWQSYSQ